LASGCTGLGAGALADDLGRHPSAGARHRTTGCVARDSASETAATPPSTPGTRCHPGCQRRPCVPMCRPYSTLVLGRSRLPMLCRPATRCHEGDCPHPLAPKPRHQEPHHYPRQPATPAPMRCRCAHASRRAFHRVIRPVDNHRAQRDNACAERSSQQLAPRTGRLGRPMQHTVVVRAVAFSRPPYDPPGCRHRTYTGDEHRAEKQACHARPDPVRQP
jgi:hypothetical protein